MYTFIETHCGRKTWCFENGPSNAIKGLYERNDLSIDRIPASFLLEKTEPKLTGRGQLVRATDASDAQKLANALDGLALALEQAEAYVVQKRKSLREYIEHGQSHASSVQTWHNAQTMKYPRSIQSYKTSCAAAKKIRTTN